MFLQRTSRIALGVAICLAVLPALPAAAIPIAEQASADSAALALALEQYEAARARSVEIDARVAAVSADLDRMVAEENQWQARLRSRVITMYRSEDSGTLSLLLGASTIQDFVTRLDLLDRVARQDADNIRALKAARTEAASSAEELIGLQAEAARALDALAEEVARARAELAASEAALREYEAKLAAAEAAAAAAKRASDAAKSDPNQQLSGSGEWQVGVASHYSRTFTGRGASGEEIGPYSMMVAHKTLPFGTLIEFEYEGKRAVASVADRGPYTPGRDFDLGPGVVRVLDFSGVHEIRYRIISQ